MRSRVLIVSDIKLYSSGLLHFLSEVPQLIVVGTAGNADEALERVESLRPDVVLLDMATRQSLATIRRIVQGCPGVQVVALSVPEVEAEVIALAEAGVAGYVTRDASLDDLARGVEAAARGELRCPPGIAGTLLRRVAALAARVEAAAPVTETLTRREREVLDLMERGRSNKEIALDLRIEVATVKNHVHNILAKLQVSRRGEAAALLRRCRRGDRTPQPRGERSAVQGARTAEPDPRV